MNILYLHQYFVTPSGAGGTRSYWISQELIKNGHNVTMITSSPDIKSNRKTTDVNGINVIYLKVANSTDYNSIRQRLVSFLKFVVISIPVALKEKNIDLVIATSTPLTIGIPALTLNFFKKKPYIFEVRDLWPEVPIQMGGLKNKYLIKMSRWFEKTIYKNAVHIVTLSPGMYEGVISKDISKEKVSMIPNMSKIDAFWPRQKNEELMKKLGLQVDTFKVIYFGAMGIANDINYIIDAAKLLKKYDDIEFIFLGLAGRESRIKQRCNDEEIDNCKFLGSFAMEKLSEIVNFCDISLVTFLNLPILSTNSPNKLFDSLSAGKPIIVNSNGWTKDLVEDYNCGFYVNPLNPEDLSNKILILKNNPELLERLGKNARILAEEKYDKSLLCKEFVKAVNSLDIKV